MSRILFNSFDSAVPTAWTVLIADGIGMTDVMIRTGIFSRSVSNTIGLTTSLTRTGTFYRTINNIIGITDVITRSAMFVRKVLNTIGMSDIVTAVKIVLTPPIKWRSLFSAIFEYDGSMSLADWVTKLTDDIRWKSDKSQEIASNKERLTETMKWRPD